MPFDTIFAQILLAEGVYDNDPDDAGGETCFGIDKASNPKWGGWSTVAGLLVNNTPKNLWSGNAVLMGFVRDYYYALWAKWDMDYIPPTLQGILYGGAINQGPERVFKWLQESLIELHQIVNLDGEIGPATLSALNHTEVQNVLAKVWVKRAQAYIGLANEKPNQAKFILGWMNRLNGGL